MTVSNGIHLLLQDSHSCVIDGYDELVFILHIRIVLTLHDMDSEGCLYPSSWDNLSTDLGCVLYISGTQSGAGTALELFWNQNLQCRITMVGFEK